MTERLDAEEGHIGMSFAYFINKAAPISGVKSLMDYQVSFIGELNKKESSVLVQVIVPVTTKRYTNQRSNSKLLTHVEQGFPLS